MTLVDKSSAFTEETHREAGCGVNDVPPAL